VSSEALCPKCGKPMERSEGARCPHCGTIDTEAIVSLDKAEPVAVPPATAIQADLPPQSDKVACPRCGKIFEAVNDAEGVTWLSCPFCHEVNPDALVNRAGLPSSNRKAWGCFLVILGFLAASVGTGCIALGMAFRPRGKTPESQFVNSAVDLLWLVPLQA
jgi:DNA-directed RNA polymerase subunit RPC12/RpoP